MHIKNGKFTFLDIGFPAIIVLDSGHFEFYCMPTPLGNDSNESALIPKKLVKKSLEY